MYKHFALFILLVALAGSCLAQKTRSAIDDATVLVSMKQRDYSDITNITDRNDAIEKDRRTVIAILNRYVVETKDVESGDKAAEDSKVETADGSMDEPAEVSKDSSNKSTQDTQIEIFEDRIQNKRDYLLALPTRLGPVALALEVKVQNQWMDNKDKKGGATITKDSATISLSSESDSISLDTVLQQSFGKKRDLLKIEDFYAGAAWKLLKDSAGLDFNSCTPPDTLGNLPMVRTLLLKVQNEIAYIKQEKANQQRIQGAFIKTTSANDLADQKANLILAMDKHVYRLQRIKAELEIMKGHYELCLLKRTFSNNPTMQTLCDDFDKKYNAYLKSNNISKDIYAQSGQSISSGNKSLATLAGSAGFSMVVEGLSEYIAERIREEVLVSAMNMVKKDLTGALTINDELIEVIEGCVVDCNIDQEQKEKCNALLKESLLSGKIKIKGGFLGLGLKVSIEDDSIANSFKNACGGDIEVFRNKVNQKLRDSENKELKRALKTRAQYLIIVTKLFPQSAEFIRNYQPDRAQASLNALKEKATADLENILETIVSLESDSLVQSLFQVGSENQEKWKQSFAGIRLLDKLSKVEHPYEAINSLADSDFLGSSKNDNLKDVVTLATFISNSLLVKQNNSLVWVKHEYLSTSLASDEFKTMYKGLLKQQLLHYNFSEKNTDLFASQKQKIDSVLLSLSSSMENIQNTVTGMVKIKREDGKVDFQSVASYYMGVLDLLKEVTSSAASLSGKADEMEHVNSVLSGAYKMGELYKNLQSKKFGAAAFTAIDLILLLDPGHRLDPKVIDNLSKYGAFYSALTEAETRTDVKQAIRAVAEPVGSAKFKKMSTMYIGLSTYAGGSGEWTYNRIPGDKRLFNVSRQMSFSVPVGLSFSLSPSNNRYGFFRNSSFTLLLSGLELGEPVAYFLTQQPSDSLNSTGNTTTSENDAPTFDTGRMISPGVRLAWDLPQLPVSVIGGWSRHWVNLKGLPIDHWSIGLAIDMPIIKIYQH